MMPIEQFVSPSGQLQLQVLHESRILHTSYKNLSAVSNEEYIDFMRRCGDLLQEFQIGKVFLDQSAMVNFGLSLRAAAVNNINELMFKKAPYFLLAIVKGKSTFDNMATQTAMNLARPLSKKFLDGKMFEKADEALEWLTLYKVSG